MVSSRPVPLLFLLCMMIGTLEIKVSWKKDTLECPRFLTPSDGRCYSLAMKILVTGGSGFIGSHVANAYLAAGHQVVIVDDLSTGAIANLPKGAVFYLMDIGSPQMEKVFQIEKPDVVNHHAAQMSVVVSVRDPLLDARTNSLGLLNVLEASCRNGVKKFIFISSGGAIYGDTDLENIPEDHPPAPQSPYAIHKLLGEHYLRFYGEQHGLSWTALRYSNVFGPRQNPHGEAGVVAIFINRLLSGEVPTINAYPDEPDGMARDYVYVEDVARASLLALDKAAGEPVNIATGRMVRTRELLAAISTIMGKELKYTRAGPRPGDLRRSCLEIAKAARVLGWKPSFSLEEGLARTVSYFTAAHA
jgi:UDP-glucose 4-epimerase